MSRDAVDDVLIETVLHLLHQRDGEVDDATVDADAYRAVARAAVDALHAQHQVIERLRLRLRDLEVQIRALVPGARERAA